MTQTDRILAHLKSGQPITPLEALDLYGCFRLGARIYDLIKEGHHIESRIIRLANGKRIAQYRMTPTQRQEPKAKATVPLTREPELFLFSMAQDQHGDLI